ncbi:tyrosine-type recombinase/integrase [Lichenihabitans sp. Uapishka_5]|uniref:tyrosine-type recombinase/integrase n=1 Tax=Lichenihabitans sp. Uapishka_5 TaxID=3037302 RepID=UPI0029E802B6|nr:tyrosine-type recombinase/integrase [Lichenihabitans sp. Uapishka_5]MDX7953460.1 tyrosine-type recombinase/integrase [Lichenihabitans sp. Uapishka_5]
MSVPVVVPHPNLPARVEAETDRQLVETWVARHESRHTQRNYRRQAERFLAGAGRPLREVRVSDVQAFLAGLDGQASATRANAASAIKSLLSFAYDLGYAPFNAGKAVKAPSVKNTLAERIMPEADALLLIRMELNTRNRALLTVAYGGGLRISEVCGLRWRDLAARDGDAGQATVYGKGGKTRVILLSANTWRTLEPIRGEAGPDDPVFPSQKGGALDPSAVHRIVKAAAARAGLSTDVSAHWLRHAHASHSLDRGAPIHLVQATLGHASVATTGRYTHARPSDSSARYLGI